MTEQSTELTEEQASAWVREHFELANKYLAQLGFITDKIIMRESRYLIPYMAVWKFTTQGKKGPVWVINGDVPMDMVEESAAKDAREAVRYFALRWQMKAETILQAEQGTAQLRQQAQYLIGRAEGLYELAEQQELWEQQHA